MFMMDMISKKKTTGDKTLILFEKCSVTLNGMKTPIKHKDLGHVIIPCIIRDKTFKKVLIKLGDSVTLMPISIYMSLSIRTHIVTNITLHFIDYIIKCPYEIVEDVLLLLIGRSMINLEDGTLTLKVFDEVVKLNVFV